LKLDFSHIITLKFNNGWPYIFIDSNIYDQIKTKKYINGYQGNEHKGICIKNLSYGYSFNYFYKYCDGKWQNYIYYLITVFNGCMRNVVLKYHNRAPSIFGSSKTKTLLFLLRKEPLIIYKILKKVQVLNQIIKIY
jgi:hypothetical protein